MPRTITTSTKLVAADAEQKMFYIPLASIAAAALMSWTPGKPGKITGMSFFCSVAASTASKLATLTPAINGTALAGCAVALTTALCVQGATIAGSAAPSVGNVFDDNDVVTILGSSVTSFVEGSGYVLLQVEYGTSY